MAFYDSDEQSVSRILEMPSSVCLLDLVEYPTVSLSFSSGVNGKS